MTCGEVALGGCLGDRRAGVQVEDRHTVPIAQKTTDTPIAYPTSRDSADQSDKMKHVGPDMP